ncbi:hypothetical protein EYF80_016908 [Liparis tanakae]|uniref:Uncharacterized protein n=1 Tax=Liparis tanakae TaxID=230148 RepID=A0A4Z2I480_9TELE|nr:hypothetical protein EYF80_016908 [Liparis tanakae]
MAYESEGEAGPASSKEVRVESSALQPQQRSLRSFPASYPTIVRSPTLAGDGCKLPQKCYAAIAHNSIGANSSISRCAG